MARGNLSFKAALLIGILGIPVTGAPFPLVDPAASRLLEPPFRLQSVTDLDARLATLQKLIDFIRDASAELYLRDTPEVPGLLDQWVLTPADTEQIDRVRMTAINEARTGKDRDTSQTLKPVDDLLEIEIGRLRVIMLYARWQQSAIAQITAIDPLAGRAPPELQQALHMTTTYNNQKVSATVQKAIRMVETAGTADAIQTMTDASIESARVYNQQRSSFAERFGIPDPAQAPSFTRTAPCPPPAAGTSGNRLPRLIPVAGPDLYPQELRALHIEGTAVVKIVVSATGCETSARIVRSSGVPQLDTAALNWAQRNAFLPAESNGKAIASEADYKVEFDLKD